MMGDPYQAPKLLRFRVVAEYADGSVAQMDVENPIDMQLRDETYDDPQDIIYQAGPRVLLSIKGHMRRKFALAFTANDATDIVLQTELSKTESRPGNG